MGTFSTCFSSVHIHRICHNYSVASSSKFGVKRNCVSRELVSRTVLCDWWESSLVSELGNATTSKCRPMLQAEKPLCTLPRVFPASLISLDINMILNERGYSSYSSPRCLQSLDSLHDGIRPVSAAQPQRLVTRHAVSKPRISNSHA